jgi:hypothetical protein
MPTLRGQKPPNPTRPEIKPQVDHALNSACIHSGKPTHKEPIDDKKNIGNDLLLGPNTKGDLAITYTWIALQYKGGRPVSISDAEGCDTVGDAVDLVWKRACGKLS